MAVLMVYADLIEYGKQAVFCHVFGHKDMIVLRVGIGLLCAFTLFACLVLSLGGLGIFKTKKGGNKHMLWTTLLGSVRGAKEQNSP